MLAENKKSLWLAIGLLAVIVLTRTQHFGSAVYLPDATLAVLFLGGLLVARSGWLGLALLVAFGMDAYALGWKGVSDYCMSPGYWGLIPTYALVWGAGRWLAKREKPFAVLPYALFGWAAASTAFVLSNAFWYGFSDKVATMPVVAFAEAIGQYYLPYVGYTLMYLGLAWVAYSFLVSGFIRPKTSKV
jgi:hypothetical protein